MPPPVALLIALLIEEIWILNYQRILLTMVWIFSLGGYFRIRYPDPAIKVNDTVKIDLSNGKITDFIKFDTGTVAMVTGGRNMGRVGIITHRERHDGGFNIVHLKDAVDNEFATRESNVFVIGHEKPWISLPKGKGVKVRVERVGNVLRVVTDVFSSPLQRREIVVGRILYLGTDDRKVSTTSLGALQISLVLIFISCESNTFQFQCSCHGILLSP